MRRGIARWRWGIAAIALFGLCCVLAQPAPKSAPPARKQTQRKPGKKGNLTVGPIKLVTDRNDFWADPLKNRERIQESLMDRSEEALLVEAPDEIRIGVRETAPIVILRTARIANAAGSPFAETAVLTAIDVENNYAYARLAIPPTERHAEPELEGNREPLQEGMIGEAFALDARDTLELSWKPTRYLFTLIMRDKAQPRLPVRLLEPAGAYVDPEVVKFHEQERLKPNVPAIWPAPDPDTAIYERGPDSLPVPESKGIAMTAKRVVPIEEAGHLQLHGSFRLPILPRHVVPAAGKAGAEPLQAQYKDKSRIPTGVVPITLVATGSKAAIPFIWRLLVPTFDTIPAGSPALVTGHFAITLQGLGNVKAVAQTLFVYAFSDEVMSGPIPIAFVER